MTHLRTGEHRDSYKELIESLKSRNLYRSLRTIYGPQGAEVLIEGRRVVLMCSNNYLGLAGHPELARAASQAATEFGTGSGASRLVSGTMELHRRLEKKLASFKHAPDCLLFNSGYHANIGIISSLAGKEDVIYSDALNHASIIDGTKLSRATVRVYPHLDLSALEQMLAREPKAGRKIIITDGVFSMDGDLAPLPELVELKNRYGALLVVDEAHATGVVGPQGRGLAAFYGVESEVDVIVGTLGKALGSFGAFVVARSEIIEWLINTARSFIFSTALPPPVLAASLAAIDIIEREPERVDRLRWAARYLRGALAEMGLKVEENDIPIIPIIIGDARKAVDFANRLLEKGVFCQAIRPPSVPEGTSRLRMTVMATHTKEHLDRACEAIGEIAKDMRMICR